MRIISATTMAWANPFQTHLLAEAVRHLEEAAGEPHRNPAIEHQAIAAAETLNDRIHARARLLAAGNGVQESVIDATRRMHWAAMLLIALGALIGIGAARALPSGFPAQANVVSVLAVLLLPHSISLLFWLLVAVYGAATRRATLAGSWFGRRALDIYRVLERVLVHDAVARAAGRAWWETMLHTAAGRHRLACISHGFWIAALLGALAGCWWLMVIRQVDFVWGTTLLSTGKVQDLLGTLTHWVGAFGIPAPDAADILLSRVDDVAADPAVRRRWGLFLLGATALFGLLPRILAAGFDLALSYLFGRRLRPDPGLPGYARLRSILMPIAVERFVIDPEQTTEGETLPAGGGYPLASAASIPADAAWLALEHLPVHPPPAAQPDFAFGVIATRADRLRVLDRLMTAAPDWSAVRVHIDLATTPDQGLARLLAEIVARSIRPVHLVFEQSTRLALLSDADRNARRDDWLRLAQHAGASPDRIHLAD